MLCPLAHFSNNKFFWYCPFETGRFMIHSVSYFIVPYWHCCLGQVRSFFMAIMCTEFHVVVCNIRSEMCRTSAREASSFIHRICLRHQWHSKIPAITPSCIAKHNNCDNKEANATCNYIM